MLPGTPKSGTSIRLPIPLPQGKPGCMGSIWKAYERECSTFGSPWGNRIIFSLSTNRYEVLSNSSDSSPRKLTWVAGKSLTHGVLSFFVMFVVFRGPKSPPFHGSWDPRSLKNEMSSSWWCYYSTVSRCQTFRYIFNGHNCGESS